MSLPTHKIASQKQWFFFALLAIGIIAFLLAFERYGFIGPDYLFFYRTATEDVWLGKSILYDGNTVSYPVLPWATIVWSPLLLFPLQMGQGVLLLLTLGSMLWYLVEMPRNQDDERVPVWVLLATLFMTPLFDLSIRGNHEGYMMLGLVMAWLGWRNQRPYLLGIGIALFVTKPIHMVLVGLFFTMGVLRQWPRQQWVGVVAPTLLMLLGSFMFFGIDWPMRYVHYMTQVDMYSDLSLQNPNFYLQAAIWRFFNEMFGVPVNQGYIISFVGYIGLTVFVLVNKRFDALALAWILSGSVFLSIYVQGYHYVLIAHAMALLLWRAPRRWGWVWILSFTPFLRGFWGFQYVWIDNIYAMMVFIGITWLLWHDRHESPAQTSA